MDFDHLTEDQRARARSCKTPEDILKLAGEEGYELTDEELEAVSGGKEWYQRDKCEDVCYPHNCGTYI